MITAIAVGLPVAIPVIYFIWARDKDSRQRLATTLFLFLASSIGSFATYFSALFRDGMGPDSVPSTGIEALSRIIQGAWFYWLVAVVIAAVGIVIPEWATRRTSRK